MNPIGNGNGNGYGNGNRFVVVVDRGWIFAGDLKDCDGRITLDRVILIMRWEDIGFDGLIRDPKHPKVKLKDMPSSVDIPKDCEIFRVPVASDWGL